MKGSNENENTDREELEHYYQRTDYAGINAVIFLLHKLKGQGTRENIIPWNDTILHNLKHIYFDSLDTCEAAGWSAYITPDMKLLPCSFHNQMDNWAVDPKMHTIAAAWNSHEFAGFRQHFLTSCPDCMLQKQCMGPCVQTVYRWLEGINIPSIDNLYALSQLFGIPMDSMIIGNRKTYALRLEEFPTPPYTLSKPCRHLWRYYNYFNKPKRTPAKQEKPAGECNIDCYVSDRKCPKAVCQGSPP